MRRGLLFLSLIFIPIALEIGFYPIIPDVIMDYRITKEFLAVVCALSFTLLTMFDGERFKFPNPWAIALVIYLIMHSYIAPGLQFETKADNIIATQWEFQPMLHTLIYFGFIVAIANTCFSRQSLRLFANAFCWIGTLTALYVFVQALGWDQWQQLNNHPDSAYTTSGNMTGTFTHPNYSGSYLALCLPFMVLHRYWIRAAIIATAIFLIQSQMAMGAAVITMGLYLLYLSSKSRWIFLGVFIGLGGVAALYGLTHPEIIQFNGRLGVWTQMWNTLISSPLQEGRCLLLTGYGYGAYMYIFGGYLGSEMIQAHNDPFQFLFDNGLIGLGLLMMSLFWLIVRMKNIILKDERAFAYSMAFLSMLLCSLGSFIFQIEPHRFVAAFLVGILFNYILKGERNEKQNTSSIDLDCPNCDTRISGQLQS